MGLQVIRGTAAAPLSQLLTALEPQLRSAAGLSAWQVISPARGSAAGRLETAERLRDVQHSQYAQPTVLLVDSVGGDEEVPEVCLFCPKEIRRAYQRAKLETPLACVPSLQTEPNLYAGMQSQKIWDL